VALEFRKPNLGPFTNAFPELIAFVQNA